MTSFSGNKPAASLWLICRRHGVAGSSFYAWKRKLGVFLMTHAFVEATVAPAPPADCAARLSGGLIKLRLRGGRRVRVGRGFDRDMLIELVATLEGCLLGER